MLELLGLSSLVSMAEYIHQAPLPHYVILVSSVPGTVIQLK
jgi:hypothetical protein